MTDYDLATTMGLEVDQNESLLRLVWDPCDIDPDTGELMTSAFEKSDLRNPNRGLSVDQKSIAVVDAMVCIANRQFENPKDKVKNVPMLAEILTSRATSLAYAEDLQRVIAAIQSPVPADEVCPENPAHVEIFNVSNRNSKSAAHEIRILMQELFSTPVPFEQLVPSQDLLKRV